MFSLTCHCAAPCTGQHWPSVPALLLDTDSRKRYTSILSTNIYSSLFYIFTMEEMAERFKRDLYIGFVCSGMIIGVILCMTFGIVGIAIDGMTATNLVLVAIGGGLFAVFWIFLKDEYAETWSHEYMVYHRCCCEY